MMDNICIDCRNSADCKRKPRTDQWTVAGCSWFEANTVIANGDKIRSMSDYELADWIADILNHCENKKPEDECLDSCPLYPCCNLPFDNIENWLKAPAKEGEG